MNIAWGITGAGHFLQESYGAMRALAQKHQITTFVSRAGEEVLYMYSLFNKLGEISNGEYLREIIFESEAGASAPKAGRFLLGKYDALIVSPATSNTVAKIVHGIADSLITNAVAQANKSGTPVYIVPVDISGEVTSPLPYHIDRELCKKCDECPPKDKCPEHAILDQIDLLKCTGCGVCIDLCPHNAIKGGNVMLRIRDVDAHNVETLRSMKGITVLERPSKILTVL
ncbi:MAG: dihydromethanopterin reductase (acceptor) [Methanosarcinales archaeon]|nr:MAG: dihydromethanopterin reductase (acceptor) [Methanosarcinales archaeon]